MFAKDSSKDAAFISSERNLRADVPCLHVVDPRRSPNRIPLKKDSSMVRSPAKRRRNGFTLVELVIVVLILGILAAVAAPKMFDTATSARTNATRHSLMILRDAIQLYRAQNGALPGEAGTEADLKTDLTTMLSGTFPRCEVGNPGDTVRIQTSGAALSASGVQSWAYDNVSGQLIVNHAVGATW